MLADLSTAEWRADLDHLAGGLRHQHRNPFHTFSPEALDAAVRTLHRRIPTLASHEVIVELARIVALIGDGHTALRLTEIPGFRRYPLVLYQFSDGLFIRAITTEHASAVGTRLLAIDNTPTDEANALVRPLISCDNDMGIAAQAPTLLSIPEVLHARGLVANPEQATCTVQHHTGETTSTNLQPLPELPTRLVDARDRAQGAPTPLWLRRPADGNWYHHLPESHALYVAYNRVRDDTDRPLAAFFDQIFADVERHDPERLILDIRANDGGNNTLNQPLVHHLIRSDRINQWGRLFTIIGRLTFSAAANLAVDLERHTRTLFVGEPTGGSPNHYGENGTILLPHSDLPVNVATLWWQYSTPYDDRRWIPPDLPAPLSSTDYATNYDPAIDTALHHQPSTAPARRTSHGSPCVG